MTFTHRSLEKMRFQFSSIYSSHIFWTLFTLEVHSIKASSLNSTSLEDFLQSLLIVRSVTPFSNRKVIEMSKWSPKSGLIEWIPPPAWDLLHKCDQLLIQSKH